MKHLCAHIAAALLVMVPLSQAHAWGSMGPMTPPAAPVTAPPAPVAAPPAASGYIPQMAPTAITTLQPPPIVNMPNPADTNTQSVGPTPVTSNLDNTDLPPPPPGGWSPIRDVIYTTAANRQPVDNFLSRVPNGQSCYDASTDRANAIYGALQKLNDNGTLNNYQVEVGTMSGYQVVPGSGDTISGGTSLHTFTVVTFTERNTGKQVAYEVDNYFMPTYANPTSPPVAGDPQYNTVKVMNQVAPSRSR